ncbi:GNAT family N-acetyltransferase [Nonomuraea sp. NPDC050328]|uniref:GNAT family N-acetyltransferase n=1 Tax=Nonomuraea sp. NPDC050328 TaxID=3364361 RepID=UPI0037AACB12
MDTYQFRRPRPEDAEAVFDLIRDCDVRVIGFVDATVEDVADELDEPGFDRERDGWLVHDAAGTLVGWAWARRKGASDQIDLDVVVRPGSEELTDRLWAMVLDRAKEITTELGHEGATLDIGVYRADEAKREVVRRHGFESGTSFHRMRIDFADAAPGGRVAAPEAPAGVTLHRGTTDEVRRRIHQVHQDSFADHFGFAKVDFDDWFARRDGSSANDWEQAVLAEVDGQLAAVLLSNNQFAPDEQCGYVATLGVLPAFRGLGLGRYLLRTAFAEDAARGRKGTILHVDSNNTTPALGLYTSAGMRPILVIDVWRRRI